MRGMCRSRTTRRSAGTTGCEARAETARTACGPRNPPRACESAGCGPCGALPAGACRWQLTGTAAPSAPLFPAGLEPEAALERAAEGQDVDRIGFLVLADGRDRRLRLVLVDRLIHALDLVLVRIEQVLRRQAHDELVGQRLLDEELEVAAVFDVGDLLRLGAHVHPLLRGTELLVAGAPGQADAGDQVVEARVVDVV